jgi:hypothetical protein
VPRATETSPADRLAETVKCVPFTTAVSIGVSTEKCWTFCFSTSKSTEPAFSSTVVDSPSLGRSLTATTLCGPITIDSVPRRNATRARSPVWTERPGPTTMPTVISVPWPSAPVQACPETLETCQSAAQAARPCRFVRTVMRPVTAKARERRACMRRSCARNG